MLPHGRFVKKTILNPRWRQPFDIIRTTMTVNDKGRTENSETCFPAVGNIQPASAKVLERLPEGDRDPDSISVYTPTMLTAGTDALQADQVVYGEARYLVKAAWNWGDYGFCRAVAALMRTRGADG